MMTFLLLWTLLGIQSVQPEDKLAECIIFLSGVSSLEELDEREYERYQSYYEHPLKLNLSSRSALLSSGMLSRYQVASLCEYRDQSGDVLSASELAAVSGFSREYVNALSPFVDFSANAAPGMSSLATAGGHRLESRSRFSFSQGTGYLQKLRVSKADRLFLSVCAQRPLDEGISWPQNYGVSCSWQGRALSVTIGDFNAHFGQGLSFWSGFSLSSVTSVSALSKKQFGSSMYWGTSESSLQGVSVSYDFARFKPSVFYDWKHGTAGANCIYFWRTGQVGLTAALVDEDVRVSSDLRWNIRGWDSVAEYSYDITTKSSAGLAGTSAYLGDRCRLGAVLRSYGSEFNTSMAAPVRTFSDFSSETGASVCVELSGRKWITPAASFAGVRKSSFCLTLDYAMKAASAKASSDNTQQVKALLLWTWHPSAQFCSKARAVWRLRIEDDPMKLEFREDFQWTDGRWGASMRLHWAHVRSDAFLVCLDQFFQTEKLSLRLREELFHVDNWDDRIYLYEYDVPGCFNVPALYGRGYGISARVGWKIWKAGKLWLKCSLLSYRRGEAQVIKPLVRIQLDINQRFPR